MRIASREVADHVRRCRDRDDQIVLVISAMGKETDELLALASAVSDTQPGRELDMLITAGERKACALVCMALHDLGMPADSFTGSQAGFLTDANHGNAKILEITPERVQVALDANRVPVVAGSQGVSTTNDVTFLGPRRFRHHGGGAGPHAGGRRLRALHRRDRGCSPPIQECVPTPANSAASPLTSCWR